MYFATHIIIIITSLVSLYYMGNTSGTSKMMFNAYEVWNFKQYYRLFTHGLIHADFFHLLFNMITLYFFGRVVEFYLYFYFGQPVGTMLYLSLYISALPISCLTDLFKYRAVSSYNALGASGAVSAVLFTAIVFEPSMDIYMMFIPIGINARVFAIIYLIYCWWMGKHSNDNIAHYAHLNGAIYGMIFALIINYVTPYN